MNKNEEPGANRYKQDLEALKGAKLDDSNQYVEEQGARYRMPYRMVKEVTFEGVSQQDLIDLEHAARLQYRLLLLDPVIKAWVNFTKRHIIVIYNPMGADNIREKISLDELVQFLDNEGVHVDRNNARERDYDYYREFYSYAFNPKEIREHPPYGYTLEQWRKMRPAWERKRQEGIRRKWLQFKDYQKGYEKLHPETYGTQQE